MRHGTSHRLQPPHGSWVIVLLLGGTSWAVGGCGDDSGQGGGGASSTSSGTEAGPTTTTGSNTTNGSSSNASGSASSTGSGLPTYTISPVASDAAHFVAAFDATPSPDGAKFYFTGIDDVGDSALFSQSGGTITKVFSGSPLAGPFGVATSTDGLIVYVADPASIEAASAVDRGRIFSFEGSTPTPLSGSAGYRPRSLEVHDDGNGDLLYFTGTDTDGQPGVFTVDPGGNTVNVVAKGAPFTDPSGIAIDASGHVFVLDTSGSDDRSASVIGIDGGTATVLVPSLRVGYPGGIAVRPDGQTVFVMGYDKTKGTDAIIQIDVSATPPTQAIISTGIDTLNEPAGLHAAKAADIFALVDGKAAGSGAVFSLHP